MAKIRHIAIQVPDLEKAAAFYEGVFELQRVKKVEAPIGNAISLSDGVMNLTLLQFPEGAKGSKDGPEFAGLHHFGFVVDNERATEQRIKQHGGESTLDSVPEGNWQALHDAFAAFQVAKATPKTLAEIAPAAWSRWNSPKQKAE